MTHDHSALLTQLSFAKVMGPPVCQWVGTTCSAQDG
jgi:hypothetical protein